MLKSWGLCRAHRFILMRTEHTGPASYIVTATGDTNPRVVCWEKPRSYCSQQLQNPKPLARWRVRVHVLKCFASEDDQQHRDWHHPNDHEHLGRRRRCFHNGFRFRIQALATVWCRGFGAGSGRGGASLGLMGLYRATASWRSFCYKSMVLENRRQTKLFVTVDYLHHRRPNLVCCEFAWVQTKSLEFGVQASKRRCCGRFMVASPT